MKLVITFLALALFTLPTMAQVMEDKQEIKKEKKVIVKKMEKEDDDKVVSVDVQKSGDDERKVVIKLSDDGKEETIEWTDNGEIPEDIQKKLDEKGIDMHILNPGQKSVWMSHDGEEFEFEGEKAYVFKMEGDDENIFEFEWDGEGDMPEEMKEMMEEHDIDVDIEKMSKDGEGKKVKMKVIKKGDKGPHKAHKRMRMHGPDHMWVEKRHENKGPRLGDAYMGAQIKSTENGVELVDIMVDSPAHKAGLKKGDVVSEVNGANTKSMEDLLTLLSFFDAGDTVELKYAREGKEKTAKVTLAKRPDSYR